MRVEIWFRYPERDDQRVAELDLDAVPREGDFLTLEGTGTRVVHSVHWDLSLARSVSDGPVMPRAIVRLM